jgi:hypothetical protein
MDQIIRRDHDERNQKNKKDEGKKDENPQATGPETLRRHDRSGCTLYLGAYQPHLCLKVQCWSTVKRHSFPY